MDFSEKQKQIILIAERLFSIKGFDGTSVRDIADEAGVNIAMISYYFGSKEKLMEALFGFRTVNVKMRVESLLQNEEMPPLKKMESLVEDYIDKIMEKHEFYKIMTCEQVINKNPIIINLIYEIKKRNIDEITKLIKDGQEKGAFKKDIDILLLMNTMIGTIYQMMIGMNYYREQNNLQSIPDNQFKDQIKQKLSDHIKVLFKALLSYEA